VDKDQLLHLINHYQDITETDYRNLKSSVGEFPYFQIGHALVAKYANDHQLPSAKADITHAAFVTSQRAVLKKLVLNQLHFKDAIIEAPEHAPVLAEEAAPVTVAEPVKPPEKISTTSKTTVTDIGDIDSFLKPTAEEAAKAAEIDSLIADIKTNLNTLHHLKEELHAYDHDFFEHIHDQGQQTNEREEHEERGQEHERHEHGQWEHGHEVHEQQEHEHGHEEHGHEEHEHEEHQHEQQQGITAEDQEPSHSTDSSNENKEPSEEDDEKKKRNYQEEQRNIIESFINDGIKFEPRPKTDNNTGNQHDLAEESVQLTDDLVTESLANLYIKQGKKAKALDIYQKLIWKFPQKKAYFASLIAELKKEV